MNFLKKVVKPRLVHKQKISRYIITIIYALSPLNAFSTLINHQFMLNVECAARIFGEFRRGYVENLLRSMSEE